MFFSVCLIMFSCRAELVRERAAAADRQRSPRERETGCSV